jgi:hypothetical protein
MGGNTSSQQLGVVRACQPMMPPQVPEADMGYEDDDMDNYSPIRSE